MSISTETQPSARITTEGLFLGTPAFSSPEQLRGDALDVRSDIYAFGVTLYYLLTGQTPFKADNMVQLLARVLESTPATPASVQSGVPIELSKIVMRCLSKEPGDRFRNYAELRAALIPFSSRVPEFASLGSRSMAGMIDIAFLSTGSLLFAWIAMIEVDFESSPALFRDRSASIVFIAITILYYAICDSHFGQTGGKWLLALKTIDANGNRPMLSNALIRSAIFNLIPLLLLLPYYLYFDPSSVSNIGTSTKLQTANRLFIG